MKKEYIKPEVDLIDLTSKETLMSAEEDAIFYGLGNPFIDNDPTLSDNIWDE